MIEGMERGDKYSMSRREHWLDLALAMSLLITSSSSTCTTHRPWICCSYARCDAEISHPQRSTTVSVCYMTLATRQVAVLVSFCSRLSATNCIYFMLPNLFIYFQPWLNESTCTFKHQCRLTERKSKIFPLKMIHFLCKLRTTGKSLCVSDINCEA